MTTSNRIQINRRDTAVLDQLETCLSKSQDQAREVVQVPADLMATLQVATVSFRQDAENLLRQRSLFRDSNRQMREQEAQLRRRVRHAYQGFRRHKSKLQGSTATLMSFGLKQDGSLPDQLQRLREPLQEAKKILAAHALLEADGENYLLDPTAGELQTRIDELEAIRLLRQGARAAEQAALRQMQVTRQAAQRALRVVRHYLLAMLDNQDKLTQRKTMRDFGFSYTNPSSNGRDADAQPDDTPTRDDAPEDGGSAPNDTPSGDASEDDGSAANDTPSGDQDVNQAA